uniref:protein-serine/threonine phosphatase n=1 Tax=Romanomermis culicivorax TaxID=13658 RepID=A0A915I1R8_ROMCU
MELEQDSPDSSPKNNGKMISSTALSSTSNNSLTIGAPGSANSSVKSKEKCEFLNLVRSALIKADRRKKPSKRKIVKNQPLSDAIKLTKPLLIKLIKMAVSILVEEDTLLEIEPPVIICGDIHGQYGDLLDIFERLGWPPNKRYLFMGDYVDRGTQSVDVMALLLYLKCIFPSSVYLLR